MATAAKSYDPFAKSTRRMTREELLEAAAYFGVDPTGLDVETLRARVREVGTVRWKADNREAIEEWNIWIRENGIPHADLHLF